MSNFKIAVVVGSARRQSINRKLALALSRLGAGGARFEVAEIADLPMFNQDMEMDPPASVQRFKAAIAGADGVLFVTPEHNRSIPALLKNAIDWGTRPSGTSVWRGKTAAITGTSPGAIGTAVAQQHLRQIIGNLGALVMGGEAYIAFKPELLDDDGNIAIEATRTFLQAFIDQFLALVGALAATRPKAG
jgi:chromate reductase, NAD(P)H dehydrogenase (quinone)